jgi:hypothetical protein
MGVDEVHPNVTKNRDKYKCLYCEKVFTNGREFVAHNIQVCLPQRKGKATGQ